MKHRDAVIFIDTNLYLDFYQVTKGKELLDTLREQQDYIFVTAQVVEEVQRRKLQLAQEFLTRHFKNLEFRNFEVPDHLFDISGETTAKLREKLGDIGQRIKKINEDLITAAVETLQRISRSEDEVSKALHDLFCKAVKPTLDELQRARDRKERGNPPGKRPDPLGDQLNWEQLLTHCKGKSKLKLWIISKDKDYATKYSNARLLNPLLLQDLTRIVEPVPEVFCFDSIDKGISDFAKKTGVKAEKLPTPDQSKEFEKELNSLPPRDLRGIIVDEAAYRLPLTAMYRQRMISPALWEFMARQGADETLPITEKTDT